MRFGLRFVFALTLVVAVFFAISKTAGFGVAGGILVALLAMAWACFFRRRGPIIYVRTGIAVFAMTTIWFLAVDWSWFVGQCPDCQVWRFVDHYRVLGVPIRTTVRDDGSLLTLVASDAGVPCPHSNLELWQKERWWGLYYCRCPCMQGTVGLADDTRRYTAPVAAQFKALAAADPDFANRLRDRVLQKHDFPSFYQFFNDIAGPPVIPDWAKEETPTENPESEAIIPVPPASVPSSGM